jgi:uncharacterized protein YutE (UPF0331/DUF86 family)
VLFTLAVPTIFGLMGRPTEMGLAIAAGTLAILLLNLDKVESFRAGSLIEAKLRQAEAIVKQAEVTKEELRQLTLMNAEMVIDSLVDAGKWGSGGTKFKARQRDKIKKLLEHHGVAQEQIEQLVAPINADIDRTLQYSISSSLRMPVAQQKVDKELLDIAEDLNKTNPPTSPEDYRKAFEGREIPQETREAIENLDHFRKYGAVLRDLE